MGGGHRLRRSPLSLSVPLDGSDTVRGLRPLERQRLVADGERAAAGGGGGGPPAPAVPTGRRHYQRYKGPFIEQLSADDLKAPPKPWGAFAGEGTASYNVPASVPVLLERLEVSGVLECWA